jgi:hypothetical protein
MERRPAVTDAQVCAPRRKRYSAAASRRRARPSFTEGSRYTAIGERGT